MRFVPLLCCFFLSGFSALVFETAWSREFAFVFGTSELAVVAVLAAYMAGLAGGAWLAARWAPRIRRPLLAYGVLELAIGVWALLVPHAIRGVQALYLGVLGGLDALPETLGLAAHAFHLVGAFVVLVPCTALMGATLPLLARHAVTRESEIGPRVGWLYACNTTGAIAGTLFTAFTLLPALGLRGTIHAGAAINVAVFLIALLLARGATCPAPAERAPIRGVPWILPAIALSGAVSFAHEVLWFRLLGHVLGASTAAFASMLAAFLAGIALGSAIAARWARTRSAAARGFGSAQLLAAGLGWLAFRLADRLPAQAEALGVSINHLAPGAWLAAALLLPLTLCIGATFPFAVRLLARDAEEASASSARVYAWNTLGSIVGAVGTGYVLLPVLGLEGTLVAAVGTNLALGALAGALDRPRGGARVALAGAGALALALAPPPRPDLLLRHSPLGDGRHGALTYLAVGRSATVALSERGTSLRLTTNGLPESVISPAGYPIGHATARWLSMLPVLLRPDAREMLIIGLGGGMTVAGVPESVASIDVIELEPLVVEANRRLPERAGGDPLADPRVHLRLGDARGSLVLAERAYDAVVSQPSHPWTSGASHLYTREFFALVRSRLAPDGVFVQWIGGSFLDEQRLASMLGSLNDVFEHVEVYRPGGDPVVMIGSPAPLDLVATAPAAIAAAPRAFGLEGVFRVEQAAALLALDAGTTRALAGDAPRNTDDHNRLATAGRPVLGPAGPWFAPLVAPRDPLRAALDRLDPVPLVRRLVALGFSARAKDLAKSLEPARRRLALAWIALDLRGTRRATTHFREALRLDPNLAGARLGLAWTDASASLEGLDTRGRALVEAHRARGLSWEAVRARDAELADWLPVDAWFREASELRARWRVELGDEADAARAVELLDPVIACSRTSDLLLLRARALATSGDALLAWRTLDALALNPPELAVLRPAMALARTLTGEPSRTSELVLEALAQALARAQASAAGAR